MRHMIINRPMANRTVRGFQCEANLLDEIEHQLARYFEGFKCIRIEGDQGNGSSYLLHAIANEYKNKVTHCAFLQFKEGDKFSDLTPYHLNNLATIQVVFIDNIHFILGNQQEEKALVEFLSQLAQNKVQVFYSSIREESIDHKLMIENPFSDALLGIILKPLSTELKFSWAQRLLKKHVLDEVPHELFEINQSNADFLKGLQRYIDAYNAKMGANHREMRQQSQQLKELEIRLLRTNLAILELEPRKDEVIRDQQYEKAADLRDEQKTLEQELIAIREAFNQLPILPRPSKMAMDLYHNYTRLLIILSANENSFLQMIKDIRNKIDSLNEKKKSLSTEHQKAERLELYQELVEWTNVLNKYTI